MDKTFLQFNALSGTGQQETPFKIMVNRDALSLYGEVVRPTETDTVPPGAPSGAKAFIDVLGGNGLGANVRFWVDEPMDEITAQIEVWEKLEEQHNG